MTFSRIPLEYKDSGLSGWEMFAGRIGSDKTELYRYIEGRLNSPKDDLQVWERKYPMGYSKRYEAPMDHLDD